MITQEDVLNRKSERVAVKENAVVVVLLGGWSEGDGEHMLSVIYVPTNQRSAAIQCHTGQNLMFMASEFGTLLSSSAFCKKPRQLHKTVRWNEILLTGIAVCRMFVECLCVSASARKVIAARGESDAGIL